MRAAHQVGYYNLIRFLLDVSRRRMMLSFHSYYRYLLWVAVVALDDAAGLEGSPTDGTAERSTERVKAADVW